MDDKNKFRRELEDEFQRQIIRPPAPSRKCLVLSGVIILTLTAVVAGLFWMEASGGLGR